MQSLVNPDYTAGTICADPPEFVAYPKTPRLFRDIVVTEKIDGTNAQIFIDETGQCMLIGSRNRWLRADDDNFGFAAWCRDNHEELLKLGPGRHFGEWFGKGIQRNYGLNERRFSLFNVAKWSDPLARPACCGVVPTLYAGPFMQGAILHAIEKLKREGSVAAPGFMQPEGVIVFHTAASRTFKVLIENDDKTKGAE